MRLPQPPAAYSEKDQLELRSAIEDEDRLNVKTGRDYYPGAARIILNSPDGTAWILGVDNAGATTWTAL